MTISELRSIAHCRSFIGRVPMYSDRLFFRTGDAFGVESINTVRLFCRSQTIQCALGLLRPRIIIECFILSSEHSCSNFFHQLSCVAGGFFLKGARNLYFFLAQLLIIDFIRRISSIVVPSQTRESGAFDLSARRQARKIWSSSSPNAARAFVTAYGPHNPSRLPWYAITLVPPLCLEVLMSVRDQIALQLSVCKARLAVDPRCLLQSST